MPTPKQLTFADESPDYAAFVEKFKPKKTTDDCYTPPNVYAAVADYVARRFGRDSSAFVRPFWPGADYQAADYPDGCTVVDNPPFSTITPIVDWYCAHGVKFFLFAPYLSNLGIARRQRTITHLIAPHPVRYENGAEVPTTFIHNLSPEVAAETDAELLEAIKAADAENRAKGKRELPRYDFPPEVMTSARLGYLAIHGQTFRIPRDACAQIGSLDSMDAAGKSVFGTGLILAQAQAKALAQAQAKAQAQAQRWPLSDRERAIVAMLDRQHAAGNAREGGGAP